MSAPFFRANKAPTFFLRVLIVVIIFLGILARMTGFSIEPVIQFIDAIATRDFLRNALITAILIGVTAGIIGAFVILRGLSLMGDAIGHAVLPGVAMSIHFGINPVLGATAFGLLASLFIGFVGDKSTLKKDTVMGVVFTSFFALGIILISQIRTRININNILFGNVLTVTPERVGTMIWMTVGLILLVVLFYKELLLTSFDEITAKVYGLKTKLIHYLFLFVLTLVIVLSLQITGAILIVAMIISPAATAFLWTNRMHVMMILSAFLGVISATVGIFVSVTFDISSGSSIVIVAAILFALSFTFAPKGVLKHLDARRLLRLKR